MVCVFLDVCACTSVACFAADCEIDVALFGRLLHELHHQLVGFAHHSCSVHTYQLIPRAQAPILVRCAILHYVANVDLIHQ